MSASEVRQALEVALAAMTPALNIASENMAFAPPVATVPYQKVNTLFAQPEDPEIGNSLYRERGIFQVTLMYPLQSGPGDATARADLIRSTFKRGNSYTKNSTVVTIDRTAEIGPGIVDGDRWTVPVKVRFYANVVNP